MLVLTLEHETGEVETVETTDEHPFRVGGAWARADTLVPGTTIETMHGTAGVAALAYGSQRETVYNITVRDAHTYLVGDDKVWVHNCFDLPDGVIKDSELWAAAERAAAQGRSLRLFSDEVDWARHLARNHTSRSADELVRIFHEKIKGGISGARRNPDWILHASGDVYSPSGELITNILLK